MELLRCLTGSAHSPPPPNIVPLHPYSPSTTSIPGYTPNTKDATQLVLTFSSIWLPLFGVVWMLASRYNPRLGSADKMIMLWFTLCGCLHTFFEGYFVLNHYRIGSMQDLFAQLWKEYALSDSRYLTSDTFVLAAEAVTIPVLGGLSCLMVILIANSSSYRYPVQIMVSLGHVYSDTLYYTTALIDSYLKGVDHCRPEPFYYWSYYVGLNFIWIVVPLVLLYQGVSHSSRAFAALDRISRSMRSNEVVTQSNRKPKAGS